MPNHQNSSSQSHKSGPRPWGCLGLGLASTALLLSITGTLLAFSLDSTPLMKEELTAEESATFGDGAPITTGIGLPIPSLDRPVNILILGTKVLSNDVSEPPPETQDLGYHALVDSFEGLTDTMLLVHCNPKTAQIKVLSIPRDTWVDLSGYSFSKINAANAQGGPALSAIAVHNVLGGVPIDRYVRVNVQGVEDLVEALGGVTVYVPFDMKYQDDSQHLYINLKAGKQHLNGEQALQFLRFRHDGRGDIGRIQRQQLLLRALFEQALNPGTLLRIPKVFSAIKKHLDTNLSLEEFAALGQFAFKSGKKNVDMLMLPGEAGTLGDGGSYWLPDYGAIDQLVNQHLTGESALNNAPLPNEVAIALQDSTQIPEAIWSVEDRLKIEGYNNIFVGEPWSEPLAVTRIIAQGGNAVSARLIREILGFGEVRVESTGSVGSDVTIQVGDDWRQLEAKGQ